MVIQALKTWARPYAEDRPALNMQVTGSQMMCVCVCVCGFLSCAVIAQVELRYELNMH